MKSNIPHRHSKESSLLQKEDYYKVFILRDALDIVVSEIANLLAEFPEVHVEHIGTKRGPKGAKKWIDQTSAEKLAQRHGKTLITTNSKPLTPTQAIKAGFFTEQQIVALEGQGVVIRQAPSIKPKCLINQEKKLKEQLKPWISDLRKDLEARQLDAIFINI